jgi:hypothetical protein
VWSPSDTLESTAKMLSDTCFECGGVYYRHYISSVYGKLDISIKLNPDFFNARQTSGGLVDRMSGRSSVASLLSGESSLYGAKECSDNHAENEGV